MLRRVKRFLYIGFVPKSVRHRRMRRRAVAQVLAIPAIPILGNVALPARVVNERIVIRTILIVKLDHVGDFFTSIEALCRLRAVWEGAHITLLCDPVNAAIAGKLGIFDRIVPYTFFPERFEKEPVDDLAERRRCAAVADLDLGRFDLAIDLRHDFDTRPCLSYVDAGFRVGYATAGSRPVDSPVLDLALAEIPSEGPEHLHAETRINMLVALAIDTFLPPRVRQIARLVDSAPANLPFGGGRYIVVAPCARSANRTWPLENFVALTQRVLREHDLDIVVIGSASEREQAGRFCRAFDAARCVNLAGTPLEDLPNVVARGALFIGNDTGSTHLAALLGVPTLCLYGGVSDPRVWQPIGRAVSIVHARTPCAYCHINVKEDCPYDQRCMHDIDVAQAFAQAQALLAIDAVA